MNIIFLEAVQNFGGARKSTVELARRIKETTDHSVKVVDFWGSCRPFIKALERNEIDHLILDKRDNPFIISCPSKLKMFTNYLKYGLLIRKYKSELKNIAEQFEADIIVVNNTKTLSIVSKSSTCKVAFFARGWFLPRTVKFSHKLIMRRLVDKYIAVSQSTRQAIYAGGFCGLEKIFVVPNAMDNDEVQRVKEMRPHFTNWQNETGDRPFTIMHCGGFLPSKGQHITIEIAKELKSKGVRFRIMLVGIIYKGWESEKYYQSILEKIEENNLEDCFEIILNLENVFSYFNQIDVLIHPSYTEGLPRVVMEAMSLGKPVVGNAVGGMTDYIQHGFTGYLTDFNSIDDYVEYCSLLLEDKSLYGFVSVNASSLIRNCYTSQNQVKQFLKALD